MPIEVALMPGKGQLTLTGQLGEIMQESIQAALSFTRSHAKEYNIKSADFENFDIHLHVPEGATPKDGPSAGITMATALISAFSKHKVRRNVAMTGEITLRGKVMPVGGIKEKILAAKRSGIKEIILSAKNKRDIDEIEKHYLKGLIFHYVDSVDEVLKVALMKNKVKQEMKFTFSEIKASA